MPRRRKAPRQEADEKEEVKQAATSCTKAAPEEEKRLSPRPGTRGADGKRVPPPPHLKGTPFPKKKLKPSDGDAKEALFRQEIRLRTRAECEKVCERVANWLKDDVIDANKANAMLNAVGKVLQSKTDTENMELKVADRELMRRIHEMEEQVAQIEERAWLT